MHLPYAVLIPVSIAALAFLIVAHEGGHYFVARWCKMRIERFSIGFGPGLLKKTSKKTGTTFQLAPIPFGGFVEIRGMNIAEEIDPEDRYAYPNRPVWQRFLTIFAGPATNYLAALVLAMGLYTCHGVNVPHWFGVQTVSQGYDAYGKLQANDRILEVDHVPVFIDTGPSLTDRIAASKGAEITLTIERDGQKREIHVKPRDEKDAAGKQVWRVGFSYSPQEQVQEVDVVTAAGLALQYPVIQSEKIGKMLYGIVFGKEKADPGGPLRMVEEFSKAFSHSFAQGIELVMLLSVYLGLFNLLPIPALDGGRLVFLIYEMVTRRKANAKIETMVHMAGIMALGVVMLVVLYIDIRRWI